MESVITTINDIACCGWGNVNQANQVHILKIPTDTLHTHDYVN